MPTPETTRLRLMVTVKAYPSISTKYNELVCCAGITDDKKWVRLYPVPYRDLPGQKQFEKGDVIEVTVQRREPHQDDRPESWRPVLETMKIVDKVPVENGNWEPRLQWIRPTLLKGFAELQEKQASENKSLGAFKPTKITGVEVSPDEPNWSPEQQAVIRQGDLFSNKEPLEKIPYRFRILFEDEKGKPHKLSVIDWEFYQLWRKERNRFQSAEKAAEQVRKKLEMITRSNRELILFAGNLGNPAMRKSFMILGCCWPKIDLQGRLF
jgi:hypothetical protein